MKLLFIRLRLVGDVVFTTPLIRAVRRYRPDAHLTYLVEAAAAPVVQGNPHLTEVIVIPKRRGLRRWRDDVTIARRLHAAHYDVAVDLHGGPRSAWLTWASRAPVRVGYGAFGRRWLYTHQVARPPDLAPEHSVLKQWRLAETLGIAACDPTRDAVEMMPDPRAAAQVTARLAALDITPEHPIVVVHVSAGNPFRRWPSESFVDLTVRLAEGGSNRRIFLTSGPSEREAARRVADAARQRLGARAYQVPEPGEFDLPELRALTDRAAVYIGGDSGPLHVASTTTTPIVAIFGPTLPERSMPWRDPRWFAEAVDAGELPCRPCRQRTCEPGDFRCLTTIGPARVAAAAERALAVN